MNSKLEYYKKHKALNEKFLSTEHDLSRDDIEFAIEKLITKYFKKSFKDEEWCEKLDDGSAEKEFIAEVSPKVKGRAR